jgi:peptide/nickel transport system permease protein
LFGKEEYIKNKMKSQSLNRLAWRKLKKNNISFFSLHFIILVLLVSIFAAVISPDNTPEANEMHIELATQPPFSKVLFLEILKDEYNQSSFFKSFFIGNISKFIRVPIDSFNILDDSIEYFPFNSEFNFFFWKLSNNRTNLLAWY